MHLIHPIPTPEPAELPALGAQLDHLLFRRSCARKLESARSEVYVALRPEEPKGPSRKNATAKALADFDRDYKAWLDQDEAVAIATGQVEAEQAREAVDRALSELQGRIHALPATTEHDFAVKLRTRRIGRDKYSDDAVDATGLLDSLAADLLNQSRAWNDGLPDSERTTFDWCRRVRLR